jgi:hypothetical protein
MQDLRIQTLQENSATMVKQINYLENKVLTMEAKIEKLEKGMPSQRNITKSDVLWNNSFKNKVLVSNITLCFSEFLDFLWHLNIL